MTIEQIVSVVRDPRNTKNQKYTLFELLLIVIASTISGYYDPDEMADFAKEKVSWLRKFSTYDYGTPSHETLRYFLCAINPEHLIECFTRFVKESSFDFENDVVSIDGKTMKGSGHNDSTDAIHIISAWSNSHGLTLAALESKGKKNEIKTVPEVIDMLQVKNATITLDAMGCQKEICKKIINSGNQYVLQIKDNQKNLLQQVKAYHHILLRTNFENILYSEFETVEKSHGRIEHRKYTQFELTDWVDVLDDWPGLKTAIHVSRSREIKGKVVTEESWYISSRDPDAEKASKAVRQHWGVENQLHWRLDVIFEDDGCLMHSGFGPVNISLIKRFCMNLLTKDQSKKPTKKKIMRAAITDSYRERMLFG